jgi:hypothetical protein
MSAHNHLQEGLIAEYTLPAVGNGGVIVPDRSPAVIAIRTAAAETRSLPDPLNVGIRLTICMEVDGGDCVIASASPINQAGNNRITLNDPGDTVELVAISVAGAPKWRVVANDGAVLATV